MKPTNGSDTSDNLEGVVNVRERLEQQREWRRQHKAEEDALYERLDDLMGNVDDSKVRAEARRLVAKIQQIEWKKVAQPLEISLEVLKHLGATRYRRIIATQLDGLTMEDRLLWLDNLKFIMTPDLRKLLLKLSRVREWVAMGQRRHFSIGGPARMGKTTFMEWYVLINAPIVKKRHNRVPVAKIQAPVSNRSPLPLLRRMVRPFGKVYTKGLNEEDLLDLAITLAYGCRNEVLMIDEAGHIHTWELKRRLIEFSNEATRVVIVCASVSPVKWLNGDAELEGRFDDIHILKPYKGKRLRQLLGLIDIILGFRAPDDSTTDTVNASLASKYISLTDPEIVVLIEQWTHGILGDIVALIYDAAKEAILHAQAGLTREGLQEASRRLTNDSLRKIKRDLRSHKRRAESAAG